MSLAQPSLNYFCLRCKHIHSKYDGICVENLKSNGRTCTCDKDSFVPDGNNPAYKDERYYLKLFSELDSVTARVEKTITAIEGARDLPDWEFELCCWRYWFGFKQGDLFTAEVIQKIKEEGQPETIRRTRQKICHDELETLHQFQEMLNNTREFSDAYWDITKQLKEFWTKSKYIPKNIEYLKAKGIKQSVIFEWSIEELNNIC